LIGSPIKDETLLEAALKLARLAYKLLKTTENDASNGDMPIPDAGRRMRPASTTVVDDAPWLEKRLKHAALPLVHPRLDRDAALALGAQPLSKCLVEVPGRCVVGSANCPPDALRSLETWQANLRSPAFAAAVRRAASVSNETTTTTTSSSKESPNNNNYRKKQLDARKLAALREATLSAASVLKSRFLLHGRDVTADESGAQALVVEEKPGKPLAYVLAEDGGLRPGFRRRWRASLAIALDRFLGGPGVLRESAALLGELLTVDDKAEMAEVLNIYEIPSSQLDHRLGETFTEDNGDVLVPLLDENPSVGDLVFVVDDDSGLATQGRVLQALSESSTWLVALAPDLGDTREVRRDGLRKRTKKPRMALEEEEAASLVGRGHDLAGEEERRGARVRIANDDAAWIASEQAARERIVEREREAQIEPEPVGIDSYLSAEVLGSSGNSNEAPVAAAVKNVVRRQRVSPGFDLVRVGNVARHPGVAPDVAFFHHRLSDYSKERRRLVKECAFVLDDVCGDRCFGYDPAKIALFFQPNVVSRFIRQKLLFNIHPIEQHCRRKSGGGTLADARREAFTYCYFFGLAVHKLAHFFDVVHGTRHDFMMTEYRCHYALKLVELLAYRGFDPAAVERDYGHLLHQEVD